MEQIELAYGDRTLTLTKSDTLVGVRPRPGVRRWAPQHTPPLRNAAPTSDGALGGFEVVRLEDDDAEATLDATRAAPEVEAATHIYHTSDDGVPFVPTGQIYVEFAADATEEQMQALVQRHHLAVVKAEEERALVLRVTPHSSNPVKTAKALQASPFVTVAEPDLATPAQLHAFALPSDGLLGEQWHLRNTGRHRGTTLNFRAGADARVVEAWQQGGQLGSPEVIVAVIDDGFDLGHPEFGGAEKVVAPWDFIRGNDRPLPDPNAGDWHGTACAGVAVGNADGGGIVGAAPGCRLMPVRMTMSLSDDAVVALFDYVRARGAWVVSCSWGPSARRYVLPHRQARAIERCAREGRGGRGCVICFAAGNEALDVDDPAGRTLNGFAAHPDVVAVAASTSMDEAASYSNFGQCISVCAPSSERGAWGITTADVRGTFARNGREREAGYAPGAYTDTFGGTSSACPLVAGVCALLLSARPELTAAKVKAALERTARRIGDPADYDGRGHAPRFGFGCVDAAAALEGVLAEAAPLARDRRGDGRPRTATA